MYQSSSTEWYFSKTGHQTTQRWALLCTQYTIPIYSIYIDLSAEACISDRIWYSDNYRTLKTYTYRNEIAYGISSFNQCVADPECLSDHGSWYFTIPHLGSRIHSHSKVWAGDPGRDLISDPGSGFATLLSTIRQATKSSNYIYPTDLKWTILFFYLCFAVLLIFLWISSCSWCRPPCCMLSCCCWHPWCP